jgi:hypothetical protein
VPNTEYRGEDLTQELAQFIAEFGPTLILVPARRISTPTTAPPGTSWRTRWETSRAFIPGWRPTS